MGWRLSLKTAYRLVVIMYKYICGYCGAHLDPDEKCDCGLCNVIETEEPDYTDRLWDEYYCNQ